MKKFTETYLNAICENSQKVSPICENVKFSEDSIINHILENVKSFADKINNGFGWIEESDVMRQFYEVFPEFENAIFDTSKLEEFVIKELKNHTEVRDE